MLIYFVTVVLSLLVFMFVVTQNITKVLGVYSRPGKLFTLKYYAFLVLFKLRRFQSRKARQSDRSDVGLGKKSRNSPAEMERSQDLTLSHSKAVDAVYFNGGDAEGHFFVGATARRHDKLLQTLCIIRIPGLGVLELPTQPDTALYRSEELAYSANGFTIQLKEPMKTWSVTYSGKMRLTVDGEESDQVDVTFDLAWHATTDYFDFDTGLDPEAISVAIATESWSRKFFKMLKESHQTHYEQFGQLSGTVRVADRGDYALRLRGVRDHSYGNVRDWSYFHRYAIQYACLEDGTSLCVGNICMPITTSRLIIGYVFHPDGRLDTVSSTDLELYRTGEDGSDPTHFAFNFIAGGKEYTLEGRVLDRVVFYMGLDWEARIVERLCHYSVNGVAGWGVSEFCYRNLTGKPDQYKTTEDKREQ